MLLLMWLSIPDIPNIQHLFLKDLSLHLLYFLSLLCSTLPPKFTKKGKKHFLPTPLPITVEYGQRWDEEELSQACSRFPLWSAVWYKAPQTAVMMVWLPKALVCQSLILITKISSAHIKHRAT